MIHIHTDSNRNHIALNARREQKKTTRNGGERHFKIKLQLIFSYSWPNTVAQHSVLIIHRSRCLREPTAGSTWSERKAQRPKRPKQVSEYISHLNGEREVRDERNGGGWLSDGIPHLVEGMSPSAADAAGCLFYPLNCVFSRRFARVCNCSLAGQRLERRHCIQFSLEYLIDRNCRTLRFIIIAHSCVCFRRDNHRYKGN